MYRLLKEVKVEMQFITEDRISTDTKFNKCLTQRGVGVYFEWNARARTVMEDNLLEELISIANSVASILRSPQFALVSH